MSWSFPDGARRSGRHPRHFVAEHTSPKPFVKGVMVALFSPYLFQWTVQSCMAWPFSFHLLPLFYTINSYHHYNVLIHTHINFR
jgi:hypothetical protein